jgi:hypothetical protein
LKIVEKLASNQITVRFCHNESWGFDAFVVDDNIDFIDGTSLLAYDTAIVTDVTRIDNYNILLTLNKDVSYDTKLNTHYVENVTWTPNVHVSGCTFESISTRGILCTTRGTVLIENNTFMRTFMSAILISDDVNSWYESGFVRDVTIRNNTFDNCGNSVISIEPSSPCTNPDLAVHNNITVIGNNFCMNGTTQIYVAGVNGFYFTDNIVKAEGILINCNGSKDIIVSGNTFAKSIVVKEINFSNMYANTDLVSPEQGFTVNRINVNSTLVSEQNSKNH